MKIKLFVFGTFICLLASIELVGQMAIIKDDIVISKADSAIILKIDDYRGNLYWQQSLDSTNWYTQTNNDIDSIVITSLFDASYRALILEGNCNPIYSDTIYIQTPDSSKTNYSGYKLELAYPDSIGEMVKVILGKDTLNCELINGEYIFQGDIILSPDQIYSDSLLKGCGIPPYDYSTINRRWPNKTVYYKISSVLNVGKIRKAIEHWKDNTILDFVEIEGNEHENYIDFVYAFSGSSSKLGMTGGRQEIKVETFCTTGTVIHEIGHAVGLMHEHSRTDRLDYINFYEENLRKDDKAKINYQMIDWMINRGPMDFSSIMLYSSFDFSIDKTKPVMTKKSNDMPFIAQRIGLSAGDIAMVNLIYSDKPTVLILDTRQVSDTSITIEGQVTDTGGAQILERGICWSTTANFIDVNPCDCECLTSGDGLGIFEVTISDLTPGEEIYIRAFATNIAGTNYGEEKIVRTSKLAGTFTDSRDGNTYDWVKIGDQVWMAENLAYDADEGCWAYNNDESNVVTYGRLYSWEVALEACSSGWHLPTDNEWKKLETFIGLSQKNADDNGWRGINVGTKLKSTIGWYNNGNGTDDYGFTGLPGGYRDGSGTFYFLGGGGVWWGASAYSSKSAWSRSMAHDYTELYRGYYTKSGGLSVRCVRDSIASSELSVSTNAISDTTFSTATCGGNITNNGGYDVTSRGVCWNTTGFPTINDNKTIDGIGIGEYTSNITELQPSTRYYVRAYAINSQEIAYGEEIVFTTKDTINSKTGYITDSRDGNTYKWVKIGEQIWMAENLAYLPEVSPPSDESTSEPLYYVYDYEGTDVLEAKDTENYAVYGVLYNWVAAQEACPEGWHLPSDSEWKKLELFLGMTQQQVDDFFWRGTNEGTRIMAKDKWSCIEKITNDTGFSALPGGVSSGYFGNLTELCYFWTSTEDDSIDIWYRRLECNPPDIYRDNGNRKYGLNIRCIKE